jgi:hypothetical protein
MRIFVDCDDTLVLYHADADTHPYGVLKGVRWRPNQSLVSALMATEHPVFVWSGGGKRYARFIALKLGLTFPCLDKNETSFKLVQEGDVVIDDQDLGGRRTHKPFEWPETEAENGPLTPSD